MKPLSTFRGLRLKAPNLYHILTFSTASVKKTDLCCVSGEGKKQSSPWACPEFKHLREFLFLSMCYWGQHQKLCPPMAQLTAHCSVAAGGTVYLILFRVNFFYRHFKKDLCYSKRLALEIN